MKYVFGIILNVLGWAMIFWWGLQSLYSALAGYGWLGAALIVVGGLLIFGGGMIAANWDTPPQGTPVTRRRWPISKGLFTLAFVGGIVLAFVGLWHIFVATQIWPSLFLALFGSAGAVLATMAALAQPD